jgi:hypothetical protein
LRGVIESIAIISGDHLMSKRLGNILRGLSRRFLGSQAKRRPLRSQARLSLERLEDRVVFSTWTGWNYNQLISYEINKNDDVYPHSGPTHLYLNFDGKDDITAYYHLSPDQTAKDIEEILFKTSEVFAPFNVQVSQLTGEGNYDQGSDGNTTIFIGYDPSNVKDGVKYAHAVTPGSSADAPGWNKGFDHTPNSDDHDVAYVDPYGDGTLQSTWAIVAGIAHEAGHTFGLAHVRTDISNSNPSDFLEDPEPLNDGTVNDMMSYSDPNVFFANQTFPTTGYNNTNGSKPYPLDRLGQIPKWFHPLLNFPDTQDVVTQNSFNYLQQVLGDRPPTPSYRVVHSRYLDSSVADTFIPSADTLTAANQLSATGAIANMGDHDVNQWTAPSDQVLRVNVTPAGGLQPVLIVYGIDFSNHDNDTVDVFLDPTVQDIAFQAGFVYRFAVGGASGDSTGNYTLTLANPNIEGDADFSGENDTIRIVRDYAQPDLLDVFINNPTPTPTYQVAFSVLPNITIDGKGGNDTIILDFSNGNVTPIGGINVQGGSDTDDHLNVIGPAGNELYTVKPGQLNITNALGLISFGTVETLEVMGRPEDDIFDIRGTDSETRVRLHGFGGNDSFYVDSDGYQTSTGMVKTIFSEVDIDGGGGGTDTLTLNDFSDPVPAQVTVTFNSVGASLAGDNFFGPGGRLYYERLNLLNINMGTSERNRDDGNVVYVLSTNAGTATHINTGQNGDTIYVGGSGNQIIGGDGPLGGVGPQIPGGDVSSIRSELVIDGQNGADLLKVIDKDAIAPKIVTLTNFTLGADSNDTFFAPGGKLIYKDISVLDVNMGSGGNTVNIQQTNFDTVTTFHTGAGNDTVTVCSTAPSVDGDLRGIAGSLTVDVGAGNGDLLYVSDRKAAQGNQAVVIAGNLISGFAGPSDNVPISYVGMPQLILHGSNTAAMPESFHINDPMAPVTLLTNDGKDSINVHVSHLPVTIDAGLDNDTIVVGNLGNSLDTILGAVTVGGGPGIDALQINDQGAVGDKTYDVTPISVARSGAGTITFNSSIDSLVLKTGSGNDQVNVLGLPNIQLVAVTDGSGNDRLAGPNQLNTWQVLATNAGKLDDRVDFFGIENLTGGTANDTFMISSGAGLPGKLDGGGGQNDSLDYQLWNQAVTVDLANLKATGIGTLVGIERFIGGTGSDKLIGPNSPNQWMITGVNLGQVNTMAFGILSFNSIENLQGGPSTDVFQFATTALMEGNVIGGSGNDQLDYSQFASGVRVNLPQGKASRINGTIAAIENATGGSGNDILVGDALPNVLTGNAGRDVIIGGNGADTLSGGAGDDLLIGGSTSFDTNQLALMAIMAEWSSNSSYALRRKHLLGLTPGGLNGAYKLNNATVHNDFASDSITGAGGMDWFWANFNEIMEPLQPGEKIGMN